MENFHWNALPRNLPWVWQRRYLSQRLIPWSILTDSFYHFVLPSWGDQSLLLWRTDLRLDYPLGSSRRVGCSMKARNLPNDKPGLAISDEYFTRSAQLDGTVPFSYTHDGS